MKKAMLLLLAALLMTGASARAEKARYLSWDGDRAFHSRHLSMHAGLEDCRISGNYLKVRASASGNARIVGHAEQADLVRVDMVDGNWARITVLYSADTSPDSYPGMSGWVDADYLECGCSEGTYYGGGRDAIQGGTLTSGGVNLRETASMRSRSIGKLSRGEQVRVMGRFSGGGDVFWRVARRSGQNGFVRADYLSVGGGAPSYSYSSGQTYGGGSYGGGSSQRSGVRATTGQLRVRETPGGNILGHIGPNDQLQLLGVSGGWAQIRVTSVGSWYDDVWVGMTGWVSTEFLSGLNAYGSTYDGGSYDGGSYGGSYGSGPYGGTYGSSTGAAYGADWKAILDQYYDVIAAGNYDDGSGLLPEPNLMRMEDAAYLFRDIDGDGDAELMLIGTETITACYTRKNGHIYHVFDGWARNRYVLRRDGTFYNAGSNGADNSVECVLRLSGTGLRVVRAVYDQGDNFYYTENQAAYENWGDFSVNPLSLGAQRISGSAFAQYSREMEANAESYPSGVRYFRDYIR